MERRSYLKTMLAAAADLRLGRSENVHNPIVLDVDLSVDPAKEQEMLRNFHTIFKPAAMTHPGYIDVKMCKLRSVLQGSTSSDCNYRFQLTYETEALRKQWVASPAHKKAWPTIESTLKSTNYTVLLFDSV
jgi:hypothetical protein